MMVPLLMGGLGIAQGALGFAGGMAGAGAQRGANAENLRRLREQNRQLLGQATAAAGASGVEMEGSLSSYLNKMQGELVAQERWAKRAGQDQVRAMQFGAFGSLISGFASGVSAAHAVGGPGGAGTPAPAAATQFKLEMPQSDGSGFNWSQFW